MFLVIKANCLTLLLTCYRSVRREPITLLLVVIGLLSSVRREPITLLLVVIGCYWLVIVC